MGGKWDFLGTTQRRVCHRCHHHGIATTQCHFRTRASNPAWTRDLCLDLFLFPIFVLPPIAWDGVCERERWGGSPNFGKSDWSEHKHVTQVWPIKLFYRDSPPPLLQKVRIVVQDWYTSKFRCQLTWENPMISEKEWIVTEKRRDGDFENWLHGYQYL